MRTETFNRRRIDALMPSDIPDDTKELVPVKNGVKKWAAENAYLLIYITLMSSIGWVVTVIVNATS